MCFRILCCLIRYMYIILLAAQLQFVDIIFQKWKISGFKWCWWLENRNFWITFEITWKLLFRLRTSCYMSCIAHNQLQISVRQTGLWLQIQGCAMYHWFQIEVSATHHWLKIKGRQGHHWLQRKLCWLKNLPLPHVTWIYWKTCQRFIS